MVKRALITELLAMLMIGDGIIALLYPTSHPRLWRAGPPSWEAAMTIFARRPGMTRMLAAVEIGAGLWLAARQQPRTTDRSS